MKGGSPPLRFLVLVVGGWICLRAAMLVPGWSDAPAAPVPIRIAAADEQSSRSALADVPRSSAEAISIAASAHRSFNTIAGPPIRRNHATLPRAVSPLELTDSEDVPVLPAHSRVATAQPTSPFPRPSFAGSKRFDDRWSGSAWLFGRGGESASLAPGGVLGGAQAGARLLYRLNRDAGRPLALSMRVYAPLREAAGAEAAIGVEWTPAKDVPVRLLAERRQAIGRDGRSAFSLMAHGGVSDAATGPFLVDAYGQAGVVGMKSRDLFADGSLRISVPAGDFGIGVGTWAATQPGVSRVDVGPQAYYKLPLKGSNIRVSADWRLRVAGDAAPNSGPTLSLAADF